jgi:hypothetical protein
MGVNYFSNDQIKLLSNNKYVVKVSEKAITYSEEFKNIFVSEYEKGVLPRIIFEKCGFSYEILGKKRINCSTQRWMKQLKREDGLTDTRKMNSGRPSERELSDEEKIGRLKNKIAILEQENTYLKKIRLIEKAALRKAQRDKNTN